MAPPIETSSSPSSTGPSADKSTRPAVWDDLARDYDRERTHDTVYHSCTQEALHRISKGNSQFMALDAACGTGLSTLPLVQRFRRVVACDFSYESLQVIRTKTIGRKVLLVQADIRRLPFVSGAFGAALCANALQHLQPGDSQRAAVGELQRVLRDEGRLVVSVHHYSRAKRRAGWTKEGKPGQAGVDYIFRFTRKDLASLLPSAEISAAGFPVLARYPFFSGVLQRIAARLFGRLLARLDFGHELLGVLRTRAERQSAWRPAAAQQL